MRGLLIESKLATKSSHNMKIFKTTATITSAIDLSPTAREITLELTEPIEFIAGALINVFMMIDGSSVRRAYSISSADTTHKTITITVRNTNSGMMSPRFWDTEIVGTTLDIMGPLGLNTADKIVSNKVYLFGFGIGAGVIKSLAEHLAYRQNIESLVIMTGSRTENEIIYHDYFSDLAKQFSHIQFVPVVSQGATNEHVSGYIQNHISRYDFNGADVYICGAEAHCTELADTIRVTDPMNCNFLIEGFH